MSQDDASKIIVIDNDTGRAVTAPSVRSAFAATIRHWIDERRARREFTTGWKRQRNPDKSAWDPYVNVQTGTEIRSLHFPRIVWEERSGQAFPRVTIEYAHLTYRPGKFYGVQWEKGHWELMPTSMNILMTDSGYGGGGPGWDGPKLRRFDSFKDALAALKKWEEDKIAAYYSGDSFSEGPFFNSLGKLLEDVAHHYDRLIANGSEEDIANMHACLTQWYKTYKGTEIVSPEELADTRDYDGIGGKNTPRGKRPWINWRDAAEKYGFMRDAKPDALPAASASAGKPRLVSR